MANLTFSSPNISDEVKKRTNDFFDLVSKEYGNLDIDSSEYKQEHQDRETKLLTLVQLGIDFEATDKYGYTALIRAVYQGHTEIVEALIALKADLNAQDKDGNTALIWAIRREYTEIAKTLIFAEAAINVIDIYGNTALIWAAYKGHTEVVEVLIAAGANIYLANSEGKTAKDYIKEKLGEDYYNKLLDKATQFYKDYKASTT